MSTIKEMTENVEQAKEILKESNKQDDECLMYLELDKNNKNNNDDDDDDDNRDFIKCSSNTDPNALAFYIAREFETKSDCVVIQTIGPQALSKAILAIIRLKSIVAPYIDGSTLVARFSVRKLQLPNGEERTTIRTRLFPVPDRYVV